MQIGGADGFPLVLPLAPAAYTGFTLQLDGAGTLQFDEFKAWTDPLQTWPRNLAYMAPTSASSAWKESTGPECGVDGTVSGDLGYHGKRQQKPWWKVDIEDGSELSYLTLFNRVRFHAQRMQTLKVIGHHPDGTETFLFDQRDPASFHLVASSRLRNLRTRLAQQIGFRATDWAVRELPGASVMSFTEANALRLLDRVAERLEHQLQGAGTPSPLWQTETEVALRSLLPLRLGLEDGQRLTFDVRQFSKIHLRSGLPAVAADRFAGSFVTTGLTNAAVDPEHHFDARSAITGLRRTWDVTGDVLQITGALHARECRHWELWGEDSSGHQFLIYDSTSLTRSVSQLQWLVGEMGRYTFSGFATMAHALETQNQCDEAFWLAKYYAADAPTNAELAAFLSDVERRSRIDPTRVGVSRTKHGYKNTFRFRNKQKQVLGLQIIIDRLAELGLTAVPAYGTLLGFLREGTLIDHDDDLDVVVLSECSDAESMMTWRSEIVEQLSAETDWKIYDPNLPGKNIPVGLHVDGEYVHCDLFPSFVSGENVHVLHENLGGLQPIDAAFFEGERTVTIEDLDFTIPEGSEDLLAWWYGDWRTPNPGYRLAFAWEKKDSVNVPPKQRKSGKKSGRQAPPPKSETAGPVA